jgi:integrase
VSPIRRNGTYYLHIPLQSGGWKLRTTGTGNATVYRGMKAMLVKLRDARRWALLAAVVNGRLTLGALYDSHVANTLDALEASLSASRLDSHVLAYRQALASLGRAPRYVAGVSTKLASFIAACPSGTTADLTIPVVARWLGSLRTTPGTRRQYLFAVTGFARHLVRSGVLAGYPLTGIEAPKKNAPRMRYVSEADDLRIVQAASPKYRALFAFIKATGCDVSTAFRTLRRDVDLERGVAELRGTKTARRHVQEALIEAWALPYLRVPLTNALPNAPLWPPKTGKIGAHGRRFTEGYSVSGAGHHHKATCKALGIASYTLKDARHSVAVRMARQGYTPFEIAEQLGTSADLVASTYARFIVKIERRVTAHVTKSSEGAS